MEFYVLTLFPEMIEGAMSHSILKRARDKGAISVSAVNIRDFAVNAYGQADDYPYGGGAGMVMMPQPVYDAYKSLEDRLPPRPRVIFMTPQGRTFNQAMAEELSRESALVILCGHYEGVDERVIEEIVTDEISIGDYVLTGGETAAVVLIDAVARLAPGVLHNEDSAREESFSEGLLEYPQYTRPCEFLGRKVPEVLISGNHGKIDEWRRAAAIERTAKRRPDMLAMKDGEQEPVI